jgi:hypothetical protein
MINDYVVMQRVADLVKKVPVLTHFNELADYEL